MGPGALAAIHQDSVLSISVLPSRVAHRHHEQQHIDPLSDISISHPFKVPQIGTDEENRIPRDTSNGWQQRPK